jgi:hypothetical protein
MKVKRKANGIWSERNGSEQEGEGRTEKIQRKN